MKINKTNFLKFFIIFIIFISFQCGNSVVRVPGNATIIRLRKRPEMQISQNPKKLILRWISSEEMIKLLIAFVTSSFNL